MDIALKEFSYRFPNNKKPVSILILMDIALKGRWHTFNGKRVYVSILILMDIALKELNTPRRIPTT